jgi:NitT/TauT family transport system ATP-binding protein
MPNAICIKGLRKQFIESEGSIVSVFDGFDLQIEADSITCIVGPSGCGKTTLLNIISGLEMADEGSVQFEASLRGGSKLSLGYMFQRDRLLPWRTTLQNAMLGVEVLNADMGSCVEEAKRLLVKFGLGGFEDLYPSELSEGMRQRVALARTLLVRPKLLLLDEPFASIDYEVRLSLENELLRRVREEKITTVFVSHDLEEAIVLGNRVIALTPRPARIRHVYEITVPLEARDALTMRQSDEFRKCLSRLASDVLQLS